MLEKLVIIGSSEAAHTQAQLHASFFKKNDLKWSCRLLENLSQQEAREVIEKRDYSALILDDPYKELGVQCADVKAASAKLAFGTDLLIRKDQILLAYEIEGSARAAYLMREGFEYKGALVLVSGEGPAALADVLAASMLGAQKVVLVSGNKQETKQRLRAFVAEFGNLAYAAIDLPSADSNQLSFRAAYDQTVFSFGSYSTSTKIFEEADIVIEHRNESEPGVSVAYAVSIQEVLEDIFTLGLDMSREDMFTIMAAAYNQE